MSNNKTSSAVRLFGDLKVRPKLMVLHNLFFLVLTCAVYFSIIPLFEKQVADAQARELTILHQTPTSGQDLNAPKESYEEAVARARLILFLVLGSIYVLAVLVLESAIMPLYVYRPLQRMLDADAATQKGDRDREMIPPTEILGDEIGQIMRSRNETVAALRRQEDELAAALRRIEEQDRLVSLGLLSASVAHELNTPLAVLNGSIEKLIETTKDQPTLDRLARMQRVAQRLQKISESLVDFSRVRHQHMGPLVIRPLIEEAWGLVAIDDKSATVEFTIHLAPDEAVVGNPDRLVQVFVNLLRNALNAVEPGSGKIEVRSRCGPRGVTIAVEDNGRGIPPDVLPEIFDAFVSTRLDARGTGLGLTVAEGIVRQHGGTISASNRTEGGARLEVTLPAARD
ncbi:MAG TPA: HAMP domain-containing sensor histidine kinase [Bryobacteraceae bacterium]|nr:HAMP domain-containing sensor histidine kinase [Bryobacteraceae bacterium]